MNLSKSESCSYICECTSLNGYNRHLYTLCKYCRGNPEQSMNSVVVSYYESFKKKSAMNNVNKGKGTLFQFCISTIIKNKSLLTSILKDSSIEDYIKTQIKFANQRLKPSSNSFKQSFGLTIKLPYTLSPSPATNPCSEEYNENDQDTDIEDVDRLDDELFHLEL
jgi:hypothetical protein